MPKRPTLPYTPFDAQMDFHIDPRRFRVLDCGRRWGKSLAGINEAFKMLCNTAAKLNRPARGWIIAPTFPMVEEDWRIAEEWLGMAITERQSTKMRMTFGPYGEIEFKSADRGDEGLRGAGLDFAVFDEAALVDERAWTYGVRPALSDRQGRAVFISTPKGRNWFYQLFLKGQLGGQPDWKSWKLPTNSRPGFPKEEWDELVRTQPEMILKQEFLADFLEDSGSVFHNLNRCFRGMFSDPMPSCRYLIGVDLAKTEDFTAICVVDRCHHQVVELFQRREVDWKIQKALIEMVAERYNRADVIVDSTGLGDPIEEDLRRAGVNVRGFKFGTVSKDNLVEEMMVVIEQGLIGIPEIAQTQWLLNELRSYTYTRLPSGRIRYHAPSGQHDDGVIALGLVLYEMRQELSDTIKTSMKLEENPLMTYEDYVKITTNAAAYRRSHPQFPRVITQLSHDYHQLVH